MIYKYYKMLYKIKELHVIGSNRFCFQKHYYQINSFISENGKQFNDFFVSMRMLSSNRERNILLKESTQKRTI